MADNLDVQKYASVPDVPLVVDTANRVLPRQVSTGTSRGQQNILGADGSKVVIGEFGDTPPTFGIAFYDSGGNLVNKIVGPTQYVYDLTTGKNIIQIGKLPDGSYGMAVAKAGFDVADGIV
jgi:hypothetical protein